MNDYTSLVVGAVSGAAFFLSTLFIIRYKERRNRQLPPKQSLQKTLDFGSAEKSNDGLLAGHR
jgi:hypothetical protein